MESLKVILALIGVSLIKLAWAVFPNLVASEVYDWSPRIADLILRASVRLLPPHDRSNSLEEWRAHVSDVPGHISKLVTAVAISSSSFRVALEQYPFDRYLAHLLDSEFGHYGRWEGVVVEDRRYSLAVHYRMAPEQEAAIRQEVAAICAEWPGVIVVPGILMVEVKYKPRHS